MDLKGLFTEHPRSVNETYLEHMRAALSFAGPLAKASAAAFVHAFLPFLCVTTASGTVRRLHDRMVVNRIRAQARPGQPGPRDLAGWDPVI